MSELSVQEIIEKYNFGVERHFAHSSVFVFNTRLIRPSPSEVSKVAKALVKAFKDAGVECVAHLATTKSYLISLPANDVEAPEKIKEAIQEQDREREREQTHIEKMNDAKYTPHLAIHLSADGPPNKGSWRQARDAVIDRILSQLRNELTFH